MMRQPHFHAAQHIEQQPHTLPDLVPGFAQPRIAARRDGPFSLRQRFSRMRQEVLLLVAIGAAQP